MRGKRRRPSRTPPFVEWNDTQDAVRMGSGEGYAEVGETIDEFVDDFLSVSRDQVVAFLREPGRVLLARIAGPT